MTEALLQTVALVPAGAGLWYLIRKAAAIGGLVRPIVYAGFLVRAVIAQILFWISYLQLPIARSLQLGEGFWFFGSDGKLYFAGATAAADSGVAAIIYFTRTAASVSYVQVLSFFAMLFGPVSSVAILLNLFCFVGACLLMVRWAGWTRDGGHAVLIAVAALSLSPAAILWAMQPLKDTFFQFVVVAFAASAALWQYSWRIQNRPWVILGSGAAMIAMLFVMSGIRWYFAFIVFAASAVFLVMVAVTAPHRKLVALACSAVLIVSFSPAFVYGGGSYVPESLQRVLLIRPAAVKEVALLDYDVTESFDKTRRGFEAAGGDTVIRTPDEPDSSPAVTPAASAPQPAAGADQKPIEEPPPRPAVNVSEDAPSQESLAPPPRETVSSRLKKLMVGMAAVVLPRFVGESLGIFRVGGGRGLLWFTDIDTLVFDALLIAVVIYVVRRFRYSTVFNPVFCLITLILILIAGPLVYTVTNFGTLFRLRGMLYVMIALIPLAAATAWRSRNARSTTDEDLTPSVVAAEPAH